MGSLRYTLSDKRKQIALCFVDNLALEWRQNVNILPPPAIR